MKPFGASRTAFFFSVSANGAPLWTNNKVRHKLSYEAGRFRHNRLAGMGDVPGSATARTLIAQPFTAWFLVSVETEMALRDTVRRNRYRLGVEFTPLKNVVDTVTIDLDGRRGDGRYNPAWFGATPRQAARTGFAVPGPGAGVYQQVTGVNWEHTSTTTGRARSS
jgi:outer membrane protein